MSVSSANRYRFADGKAAEVRRQDAHLVYVAMGIAAWRVWRRRTADGRIRALLVFAVQLLLTIVWSALFFGLHLIGLALAEIILLLFVISVNGALFWRLDRLAGALFIPYVLWVAYATVLNTALWRLN